MALRYPKGAWLIILVELFERFSFFGVLTVFVLFLTDSPAHSGFGWSGADALSLLGIFLWSMYALPALGGYLADRVLGRRRALTLGACVTMIGHALMASPVYIPLILGKLTHLPLLAALHALPGPLGHLIVPESLQTLISLKGGQLDPIRGTLWLKHTYVGAAIGFYAAFFCLVMGNALMKTPIVALCGDAFEKDDPRRDGAYAYLYITVPTAALLSGLLVGVVAQTYGWGAGFAVTAASMAVSLLAYLGFGRRWLGSLGKGLSIIRASSQHDLSERSPSFADTQRGNTCQRLIALTVLAILLSVFTIGSFQLVGSWSLFILRSVNRTFYGFMVPVTWFNSWNSLVMILLAPAVASLWTRLSARRRGVDIVQKYVFALLTVALGHAVVYEGALSAASGAAVSAWIPIAAVTIVAVGELVAWTSTFPLVYRTAPAGYVSLTIGIWYLLTLGAGGYLASAVGRWIESLGPSTGFLSLGGLMLAGAVAGMLLRAPLLRIAARGRFSL